MRAGEASSWEKGYSEQVGIQAKTGTLWFDKIQGQLVAEDLHLEQLDVKTTFLHGELEEDLYMQQSKGYVETGKECLVCKLKKSLYGLKEVLRQWYLKFYKFLLRNGYTRCHKDRFCYFKSFEISYIVLLLYVDDMLVVGSNMREIRKLKEQMVRRFSMKDLGAANRILGLRIERSRKDKVLKLCQKEYFSKVLKRFNMENSKPVSTTLIGHFRNISMQDNPKSKEEESKMSKIPYASTVESFMYVMVCTRSDISHVVGVMNRFMSKPRIRH
ncbi:Retrovirus-related Pol polyprotein from transposon TNT 1-94-like protein [Drosera capensis]